MTVSHNPSCFQKLEPNHLPIKPPSLLEYFSGLNRSTGEMGKLVCPSRGHRRSRRVASSFSSAEGAGSDSGGEIPPSPLQPQVSFALSVCRPLHELDVQFCSIYSDVHLISISKHATFTCIGAIPYLLARFSQLIVLLSWYKVLFSIRICLISCLIMVVPVLTL